MILDIVLLVIFTPLLIFAGMLTFELRRGFQSKRGDIEYEGNYKGSCDASWQVSVIGGNLYEIKCRNCGVRLEGGSTPKCKKV